MNKFHIALLSAILFFSFHTMAYTQEYGKIRALSQRAAYVTEKK